MAFIFESNSAILKKVTKMFYLFSDTKEKEQHRFHDFSSNYITGESFTIECPILDSLMPTVTWSRDVSPELDTLGDRMTVEDIGNVIKNGRLTLKDLVTEDRGHYICRAEWYSGNATFKHLVRVKSEYLYNVRITRTDSYLGLLFTVNPYENPA